MSTNFSRYDKVGSRCIPGAYTYDSDFDILVYKDNNNLQSLMAEYKDNGWEILDYPGEHFFSACKIFIDHPHHHNHIVTDNKEFFNKFLDAQKLAEKLQLIRKEDRISLFRYVLYGEL